MKNTAINTLTYTGVVTLSQYVGKKKLQIAQMHNTGGDYLFEFLAECLAGNLDKARAIRPTKVMILRSTDLLAFDDIAGTFYLITKPEKLNKRGGMGVRYSFLLPKNVIEDINTFDNIYLALYADAVDTTKPANLSNYAALCKLEITKNNIINASLAIDWELIISNKTVAN